jgi:hypothetical protein
MNDLKEQVNNEDYPIQPNEKGQPQVMDWDADRLFDHHARLYIKYISIYRRLEECYDQMVHPQKRIFIRKVLESTMIRICETKKSMIKEQPRTNSLYTHLDSLLTQMKYDPTVIELPVPRYFKDDAKNEVELIFAEKVKRDGDKAKKEKKKKKKKGGDKEEVPEEKETILKKEKWIDDTSRDAFGTTEPAQEVVMADPFDDKLSMDFLLAITVIQKNERGRQGCARYLAWKENIRKKYIEEKKKE